MNVEFQPRARSEARAASRWYARASQAVSSRFTAAFDAAVAAIQSNPVGQAPYLYQTRIVRLKGFPYLLVFVELAPDVL